MCVVYVVDTSLCCTFFTDLVLSEVLGLLLDSTPYKMYRIANLGELSHCCALLHSFGSVGGCRIVGAGCQILPLARGT